MATLKSEVILIALLVFGHFESGESIKCVQCVSDDPDCVHSPPKPLPCNGTELAYCIILEEKDLDGNLLRLTRTCSPADIMFEECEYGTEHGITILICHRACSTDGCNAASPSGGRKWNYYWLIPIALLIRTQYID